MKRLSRKFPSTRSRRLRKNHVIRDLVSDVTINKSKLIQPLFVSDENSKNIDLDSMPGQKLFSRQGLIKEIDMRLDQKERHMKVELEHLLCLSFLV